MTENWFPGEDRPVCENSVMGAVDWDRRMELREKARQLSFEPLDMVQMAAESMAEEEYEPGLPDRTMDQLMLKLALMNEVPSAIKYRDGFIVIDTSLGQFWYISDGGHSNNAGPRFTLDQVL